MMKPIELSKLKWGEIFYINNMKYFYAPMQTFNAIDASTESLCRLSYTTIVNVDRPLTLANKLCLGFTNCQIVDRIIKDYPIL